MKLWTTITAAAGLAAVTLPALAGAGQNAVLAEYLKQAKAADAGFAGFDAARGKALFSADHMGGKPDTPSCTSCHGPDPRKGGQTRAGKPIDPMAVSVQGDRFTDVAKTEKWFGRNCNSVLGRECTPQEKGDFITFMSSL